MTLNKFRRFLYALAKYSGDLSGSEQPSQGRDHPPHRSPSGGQGNGPGVGEAVPVKEIAVIRDDATFSQAFAAARAVKADEFEWRGRSYHTKTREELGLPEPERRPKHLLRVDRRS